MKNLKKASAFQAHGISIAERNFRSDLRGTLTTEFMMKDFTD